MVRTIIAMNLGGISNRVKCLISCWRLADLYDRELILEWRENHTCGCKFKDLFENEIKEIDEEQLNKIKEGDARFFEDDTLIIKDSPKRYIISGTWRFLLTPEELDRNKHLENENAFGERGIDLDFSVVPEDVKKEILKYLVKLKPLKSIQKEIDNFQEEHNLKEMVGIHIRRGDFADRKVSPGNVSSNEKFIERMNEIIKEKAETKFFLCTDSTDIEKLMEKEFPGRIIKFPKTSFVRTDVRATQEGLIDLLLLSKTKQILGTYKSTFTEMAWWFGNCEPKMEIIIDAEKQKEHFENVKKEQNKIIPKIKRVILKLMGRKFV